MSLDGESAAKAGSAIAAAVQQQKAESDSKIDIEQAKKAAKNKDQEVNIRRLIAQSILLTNRDIIQQNDINFPKSLNNNLVKILTLETETIFNKLFVSSEQIKSFNNLNSAELSVLVPYIRLFRIFPNIKTSNNESAMKEIVFSNFYPFNIDVITKSKSERGYQASLKNLNLISQGKDTATVFQYGATISFHFDSIEILLNEQYKYLWNSTQAKNTFTDDANPEYYRILIEYGWNPTPEINAFSNSGIDVKKVTAFAANSTIRMFLNYIQHSLTINEDGSVNIEVEYIGSTDVMFETSKTSNIFDKLIPGVEAKNKELQNLKNDIEKDFTIEEEENTFSSGKSVTLKDKNTGKEADSNSVVNSKKESYEKLLNETNKINENSGASLIQGVFNNIMKIYNNKIPYIKLDNEKVDEVIKYLISSTQTSELADPNEVIRGNLTGITKLISPPEKSSDTLQQGDGDSVSGDVNDLFDLKTKRIYYFKFEDLLAALGIGENSSENNFKKLFLCPIRLNKISQNAWIIPGDINGLNKTGAYGTRGEITFNGGGNIGTVNVRKNEDEMLVKLEQTEPINIGDIPISLDLFRKWFMLTFVDKNISSISMKNFIEKCCKELLMEAINAKTSFFYFPKQPITFDFDMLYSDSQNLQYYTGYTHIDTMPYEKRLISLESKKTNSHSASPICIIYAKSSILTNRKFNYEKDSEEGIYHFTYGSASSVVNKISFKREDMPYVKEASIQSQVDNSKTSKMDTMLLGKYNCDIVLHGGLNFKVGSLVFIKPTFVGISSDVNTALNYGIGGYYRITSIKTTIESGKYEVSLQCFWECRGNGTITDPRNLAEIEVKKISDMVYK